MDKRILYIGGSPCSGKSTVAQRLTADVGAYYYKVDDRLEELMACAAAQGAPACRQ